MSWMLPDWDWASAKDSLLPPWAQELTRSCNRYTFTTMQVRAGRSVVAVKSGEVTGPLLIITSSEVEM